MTKNSPIKTRQPSVKITKAKLPNYIQHAVNLNNYVPGVGKYQTQNKHRILGNYNNKGPKSAFFEEATFRGQDTPSHYNSVHIEKYKQHKTAEWKIHKPLKEPDAYIKKNNSVSPSTYKVEDKYVVQSQYNKILNFTISKAPK